MKHVKHIKQKKRIDVPPEVAAKILFLSDRTCCVCSRKEKPVQIHHIDDNPSNNDIDNLATLCFECHDLTQISGGFHRKLDPEQVILYRDDWLKMVARNRARQHYVSKISNKEQILPIELATSIAEIYRENNELELLAIHYDKIGNKELRDKYIEEVLKNNPSDSSIIFLRAMQKRSELIPKEVIDREIKRSLNNNDWSQLGRLYVDIGDYKNAVEYYIKGIEEDIQKKRFFSVAFYIKELVEEGLVNALFAMVLHDAAAKGDLWLQVRALEELGWESELKELLIKNKDKIKRSKDILLQSKLTAVLGDRDQYVKTRKELAKKTHLRGPIGYIE